MAQLGTSKRPAVVRVQTRAKADAVLALCERSGWQVIVGVEPGEPEDSPEGSPPSSVSR